MIREERDPAFWSAIAAHPAVAPHMLLNGGTVDMAQVVSLPTVLPLAAKHGGFLFAQLDNIGRIYELHTLFTPDGWGREVLQAAKQAFARVFAQGAQLVTTYEVEGWWRSRPPKSFGFLRAGDFRAVPELGAALSTWVLTSDAWDNSPARRRV